MTLICNVPHFEGVRIHWGRTIRQSEGCLLVGECDGVNTLKNIGMTDRITLMVRELQERNEKVFLEIAKP